MRPTLLVAEGDPELREVYQNYLAQRSYDVDTAADGLECLAKLRRRMPAVLVLDWEVRWGGGDGVLAWLREHGDAAGVSVVLTATGGCSLDIFGDIRPPVVKLLLKPFTLTALVEDVRAAVAANGRAG
jgi:DNA-binding response OmpR family regulator